jgi:uncharacterized protein (TIGR00369 family)
VNIDLVADRRCFVCGPENAAGLQTRFETEAGTSRARFTPGPAHQGYAEITHGGVLAALLDEAMVYAAVSLGRWVATAELTVRFRRPASTGVPLLVVATVARDTPRMVECEAEIRTETGQVVATARGKLMKGSPAAV